VAVGGLLALLVLLTVFAGPVTDQLRLTADALYAPAAYIQSNALPAPE
jgi:multicomponent K+:H+ antiporter subunit D